MTLVNVIKSIPIRHLLGVVILGMLLGFVLPTLGLFTERNIQACLAIEVDCRNRVLIGRISQIVLTDLALVSRLLAEFGLAVLIFRLILRFRSKISWKK